MSKSHFCGCGNEADRVFRETGDHLCGRCEAAINNARSIDPPPVKVNLLNMAPAAMSLGQILDLQLLCGALMLDREKLRNEKEIWGNEYAAVVMAKDETAGLRKRLETAQNDLSALVAAEIEKCARCQRNGGEPIPGLACPKCKSDVSICYYRLQQYYVCKSCGYNSIDDWGSNE